MNKSNVISAFLLSPLAAMFCLAGQSVTPASKPQIRAGFAQESLQGALSEYSSGRNFKARVDPGVCPRPASRQRRGSAGPLAFSRERAVTAIVAVG
jgi:hypothetical protein